MCTLALAWQTFADAPVVVAANRDEYYDRPADSPQPRDWERQIVAPKDERGEGTWIGYNDEGLLVGIANRWTDADLAGDRSRGLLVRDALAQDSAEAATRFVERELDERAYEEFNLLLVDNTAALLVEYDGARRVRNLDPGVSVVVNVGANGSYSIPGSREETARTQAENADALRTALQPEPGEAAADWRERAGQAIADHDFGVCIHGEAFGTTSSSLIQLGNDGAVYDYADGPPCETSYERVAGADI